MSDEIREVWDRGALGGTDYMESLGLAAEVEGVLRETVRSVLEPWALLAQNPVIQALIREYERDPDGFAARWKAARPKPCHCLCGAVHPGEPVCNSNAVLTVRGWSQITGHVNVPVCAPCGLRHHQAKLKRELGL